MGSSYSNRDYWRQQAQEAAAEERRAETAAKAKRRMALADKIVLALVDRISADIIRPGPKPEERECYVMAEELRKHSPKLTKLVTAILRIAETE